MFNSIKEKRALALHSKGNFEEAMHIYSNLFEDNYLSIRYLLAYSILLIKSSSFNKAIEVLKKADKIKNISSEHKNQIYVNYAVCLDSLGQKDLALKKLENQHNRAKSGLLYQTLGYLYINNKCYDKAFDYINESLDYDSEDAICLDNMGQYYYRKPNPDYNMAKKYFQKAIQIKPNQIDTLYFLALFDIKDNNIQEAKEKLNKAMNGNFSPLNYASKDKIESLLKTL